MLRQARAVLAVGFAVHALCLAADPAVASSANDFRIPNGHYFAQAGGFAVTNDAGVGFWDAFVRLGGVEAVGYPASRRFEHGGFVTQVMQKAVFQWRPETGEVLFVNVFDDLAAAGRNDWLLSFRSTPRPLPPDFDGDKAWSAIVRDRLALLDERPAIRARYRAVANPALRYGLPTSRVEDMGNHYAVRLQRAVIQEWKVDVPWARAGQTTVANGGDILKEAGLLPSAATEPEGPEASPQSAGRDWRVIADAMTVRTEPSTAAPEVVRVFRNAQVEVTGPIASGWAPVRVWNSLSGWAPALTISRESYPARDDRRGGGYRRPIPPAPSPSLPLPIDVAGSTNRPAQLVGGGGEPLAGLAAGRPLRVLGYRGEGRQVWLDVRADEGRGWLPAAAVDVAARDPLAPHSSGRPMAAPVSGKGAWATYDLLDRASPEAIVRAARANGLTHIYLQVGRSNLGFYGADGLNRLLPLAHANGLAVVGWVYPFLDDVVADLNLTVQVARYVTPDGHRIDALAADVEENMAADDVHAFGQLVRGRVGDDVTLVIATYPPEMASGRTYPYPTVARVWNVIAPMDYYHRPGTAYTAEEAYGYVARSIGLIRARSGRPVVVAPIGQAYSIGWPNEVGPGNPTADETRAMLRSARETGAVGISFFEWSHATEPQWREIADFAW
ncbi:MAG TPA: SH3 domain-containing protein [Chloroflexota bacterium]|jgi:hypothetical protein